MATPSLVADVQRDSDTARSVDLSPRILERAEAGRNASPPSGEASLPLELVPSGLAYASRLAHQRARNSHQHPTLLEATAQIGVERFAPAFDLDALDHQDSAIFEVPGRPFPGPDSIVIGRENPITWGAADISNGPSYLIPQRDVHIDIDIWNQIETLPGMNLLLERDNARETLQIDVPYIATAVQSPALPERPAAIVPGITPNTDVVAALRNSRYRAVAERLDYLNAELADDPDYDIDEVNPDSVVNFATFLLSEKPAAPPIVGLHPNGFVFAQWRVVRQEHDELWGGGDGSLVMVFEPSNLVNFAARSGIAEDGAKTITANGVMPVQDLQISLQYFLSRVAEFEFNED